MGSIFCGMSGTRWDRIGYDSYDFSQCFNYMGIRKWRVSTTGKRRIVVYDKTIDGAKAQACKKRGWLPSEITCVRMLYK